MMRKPTIPLKGRQKLILLLWFSTASWLLPVIHGATGVSNLPDPATGTKYFLHDQFIIEQLIYHRVSKILQGHFPQTDFFFDAIIKLNHRRILQAIRPLNTPRTIVPAATIQKSDKERWESIRQALTLTEWSALIDDVRINLGLSDRLSMQQKEMIKDAFIAVLNIPAEQIKIDGLPDKGLPLQWDQTLVPKIIADIPHQPKDNSPLAGPLSNAMQLQTLNDLPTNAFKPEKEELWKTVRSLEQEVPYEHFISLLQADEPTLNEKIETFFYQFPLLYTLRFPFAALIFGLILIFLNAKYLSFRYHTFARYKLQLIAHKNALLTAYQAFQNRARLKPFDPNDKIIKFRGKSTSKKPIPGGSLKITKGTPGFPITTSVSRSQPIIIPVIPQDTVFISEFLQRFSHQPNRYVMSACFAELMEREHGAEVILNIFHLLGEQKVVFTSNLSPAIAAGISDLAGSLRFRHVNYESSIAAIQELIIRYELGCVTTAKYGEENDLFTLASLNDSALLKYLSVADVKNAALILSLYSSSMINHYLTRLLAERKKAIYQQLGTIHEFTAQDIKKALKKLRLYVENKGTPLIDGPRLVLEMLNLMIDDEATAFIKAIDNESLASDIARNFITTNTIFRLDDKGIKLLFAEFDPKDIAHFLYLAGSKITKIVQSVQNVRRVSIIRDTLNTLKNSAKDRSAIRAKAEECQTVILARMRELLLGKEIILHNDDLRPESFFIDDDDPLQPVPEAIPS